MIRWEIYMQNNFICLLKDTKYLSDQLMNFCIRVESYF